MLRKWTEVWGHIKNSQGALKQKGNSALRLHSLAKRHTWLLCGVLEFPFRVLTLYLPMWGSLILLLLISPPSTVQNSKPRFYSFRRYSKNELLRAILYKTNFLMDNTKIRNYLMSMDTEQSRHIMKRNWHLEEVTPPKKTTYEQPKFPRFSKASQFESRSELITGQLNFQQKNPAFVG